MQAPRRNPFEEEWKVNFPPFSQLFARSPSIDTIARLRPMEFNLDQPRSAGTLYESGLREPQPDRMCGRSSVAKQLNFVHSSASAFTALTPGSSARHAEQHADGEQQGSAARSQSGRVCTPATPASTEEGRVDARRAGVAPAKLAAAFEHEAGAPSASSEAAAGAEEGLPHTERADILPPPPERADIRPTCGEEGQDDSEEASGAADSVPQAPATAERSVHWCGVAGTGTAPPPPQPSPPSTAPPRRPTLRRSASSPAMPRRAATARLLPRSASSISRDAATDAARRSLDFPPPMLLTEYLRELRRRWHDSPVEVSESVLGLGLSPPRRLPPRRAWRPDAGPWRPADLPPPPSPPPSLPSSCSHSSLPSYQSYGATPDSPPQYLPYPSPPPVYGHSVVWYPLVCANPPPLAYPPFAPMASAYPGPAHPAAGYPAGQHPFPPQPPLVPHPCRA